VSNVDKPKTPLRKSAAFFLWPHVAFWIAILVLAIGFELLVRERVLSQAAYAAPSETIQRLLTLFSRDGFATDVWLTARRALVSVLIGFPLGVGAAVGLYTLGRASSSGAMALDFIRSTPITALIPLLIVLTGIGEMSKVAIGTFSATLVTAITVWVGIQHGLQRFSLLLHLYRPNYGKRVLLVILPYTIPNMLAALKLAVSSALVLVVVAEMFLGSQGGIGKVINDRTYGDDRAAQFAAVFAAGLLGYILNVIFDGVQRVTLRTLGHPGGELAGPAPG
jgi:NitT/TauT family transport system permease protein